MSPWNWGCTPEPPGTSQTRRTAGDLKQAQQALAQGDTAAAEGLFAKSLAAGKAQAAESAFQLGELAYSRIKYGKAYGHYVEAARLRLQNPAYLNMAGSIAHDLGR